MKPIRLTLSGFLSYREPVELDFTSFDLACISGPNGAGKSSLLDAITWVLFGRARKRDDSLIHSNPLVKAAEVVFEYEYEGSTYRVQRTAPRGKTTILEFHLWVPTEDSSGNWRPLTERTLRETQAKLEQVLRLDYETFVNASFFLQGKADQFTQQPPGDRKRILGNILGLEMWEAYRQRAADRRKTIENRASALDGRLHEINTELGEESARRTRLKELQQDLEQVAAARRVQEESLENIRRVIAELAERQRLVDNLKQQWENATRRLQLSQNRLEERQQEKQTYLDLLDRSHEIQAAYEKWQQTRLDLERWEQVAVNFREQEKLRQAPLDEINAERARLSQEQYTIKGQQAEVAAQQADRIELQAQAASSQESIRALEAQVGLRQTAEQELRESDRRLAGAAEERERLKRDMNEIKAHISQLLSMESPRCPFCDQVLGPEDRQQLVAKLTLQGTELGNQYRDLKGVVDTADLKRADLELQIASASLAEADLRRMNQAYGVLESRLEQVQLALLAWETQAAPRLLELTQLLDTESFAEEARSRLTAVDVELKATGYDAAAHDQTRQDEVNLRRVESDLRALERAQATSQTLDREIAELQTQIASLLEDESHQQSAYETAAAALAASQAQAPDLHQSESRLFDLAEQENRLRLEVGAAQQKVSVLDDLKVRRGLLQLERDDLALESTKLRKLEKAFGKDGVPALLIEQALPEIEARANTILDRMTGGAMSVRFDTQAEYKDKRREEKKETLDIKISDSNGTRDYELFSGGEAFRVNFAIRMALSEVLAQRAGARLQMLVIDEGFGSQDALGRQRLIEAINLVKDDFAKILVITHIDELKDVFPTRIEVEKTPEGSILRVM